MDTNARIVSVASSSTVPAAPVAAVSSAPAEQGASRSKSSQNPNAEGATRYRLVIEEGPSMGSFIYKTLDSETGEVVRQFPREQVVRLAEARDYDAGAVIDTTV